MGDEATGLSQRMQDVLFGQKESWTRRMFEHGNALRRDGGGPVFDLSLGNPSLEPPQIWKDTIVDLLQHEQPGLHRYMTNAGFTDVRTFLAERESARYGLAFEYHDVTITVGAAGGLNVALNAIVDAGDEVLVPAPYFSEYEHYCANVNATLVRVPTGTDFALDVAQMERALGPRSRVVLLNSPNNPTGVIYDAASLDALAEVLRAHAAKLGRPIWVIEDNPYRDLTFDGALPPSMLNRFDETLFLTSHSKDLGLAGERIGYMAISPHAHERELVTRAFSFCNRVLGFVNAPALFQRALPKTLASPQGRVNVSVYAENCRVLAATFRELGFTLPEPRAGFFLFPRLPPHFQDAGDVALTERLLVERTLVVPGSAFGVPGHLRVSVATDAVTIAGSARALRRVCG